MGRAITWLSLEEKDLWSFDSLTYAYIENQNTLIWLIILLIFDSFWVVWYFSHFSSFTAKHLSAVNAEKPAPKQWDWCDSVRDMQSCSPLWESYLHESCRLSGFPQWNGSSAAQGTWAIAPVFNMWDHELLFHSVLGSKNTVENTGGWLRNQWVNYLDALNLEIMIDKGCKIDYSFFKPKDIPLIWSNLNMFVLRIQLCFTVRCAPVCAGTREWNNCSIPALPGVRYCRKLAIWNVVWAPQGQAQYFYNSKEVGVLLSENVFP